ncbi:MFS transporter [Amycolatopsis orientalis]|uniref:MFS transporter n=1 Tax=Amycolatopsis orientalis TaxID=31958 RepID=UPI00039D0F3A|nr:MFS transporter [Amycolatopsis orientalis]
MSTKAGWRVPAGLILGPFVALLDLSIVTVALPRMGADLHAGTAGQQWIVDAYAVCLAALLLSGGTLGDRYGRKRAYLIGLTVFTLASVACAAATGIGMLIAARAVQGAASALVMTGSLSLLVQAYPDPVQRARMLGLNGMIGGSSIVFGPVAGGLLVDAVGWPTIFLINLPIGACAVWLVRRAMPESSDREHAALDPAGQLLGLTFLATLTYGLIEGRDLGWASAATIVPLAVAAAAGAGFVCVERRLAKPMLPIAVFADPRFTVPNVASFVLAFGTTSVFILLSWFLQDVQHRSPRAVGLLFIPLSGVICLVAPLAARWCARYRPASVMIAGYTVSGIGLLGLLALDQNSGPLAVSGFGVVLGAGMGASIAPTQLAGVLALPRQRSGLASACIATTRQAGTAVGVAVLGVIITSAAGPPEQPGYPAGFVHGLHLAGLVSGVLTLATAALVAVTEHLRKRKAAKTFADRAEAPDKSASVEPR